MAEAIVKYFFYIISLYLLSLLFAWPRITSYFAYTRITLPTSFHVSRTHRELGECSFVESSAAEHDSECLENVIYQPFILRSKVGQTLIKERLYYILTKRDCLKVYQLWTFFRNVYKTKGLFLEVSCIIPVPGSTSRQSTLFRMNSLLQIVRFILIIA